MAQKRQPLDERDNYDFGAAIALGISFGMIFGMLLGNIAMGLVVGLLLAMLYNAYHEKKQKLPRANLALAVSFGALLVVAAIWVLSAAGLF